MGGSGYKYIYRLNYLVNTLCGNVMDELKEELTELRKYYDTMSVDDFFEEIEDSLATFYHNGYQDSKKGKSL